MSTDNNDVWKKRMGQLAAGAGSGAITKTAIAPLERVKILLQIQGMHKDLKPKYSGIVNTAYTVVKEEGFLAMYKGNGANVVRIVPTYALKFAFNDTFKDMVRASKNQQELSFGQMVASGSLAGLFQITMTYPLELVRTRLTLSEGQKQGAKFNGILDCAKQTVRIEGWTSLYKGITPTWLSGAPYVGLQMSFYEVFKKLFGVQKHEKGSLVGTLTMLAAGGCSGIVAQTITYPGDTVRRRMQANGIGGSPRIYSTTWDCCVKTVRTEGIRAMYKGLGANTVRCIPGAAIQFYAYENLKVLFNAD